MGIIITAITFARNGDGKGGDEICSPPAPRRPWLASLHEANRRVCDVFV